MLRNPSSIQRCCLLYFSNLPGMLSSTSLRTVPRRSNGVRLCVKLCEPLQDQPLMKARVLCQCALASTKTVLQEFEMFRSCAKSRTWLGMSTRPCGQTMYLDFPLWDGRCTLQRRFSWIMWPSSTIQDLLANVETWNTRVISRRRPAYDPVFDEEAWSKTKEQIAMNVATQAVDDSSEISFPQLCLVRRHGMWEQLGKSIKLLVRVLDDSFLKVDKTTLCVTNKPTFGENYSCKLMMFCSYLAKAFRQIPAEE